MMKTESATSGDGYSSDGFESLSEQSATAHSEQRRQQRRHSFSTPLAVSALDSVSGSEDDSRTFASSGEKTCRGSHGDGDGESTRPTRPHTRGSGSGQSLSETLDGGGTHGWSSRSSPATPHEHALPSSPGVVYTSDFESNTGQASTSICTSEEENKDTVSIACDNKDRTSIAPPAMVAALLSRLRATRTRWQEGIAAPSSGRVRRLGLATTDDLRNGTPPTVVVSTAALEALRRCQPRQIAAGTEVKMAGSFVCGDRLENPGREAGVDRVIVRPSVVPSLSVCSLRACVEEVSASFVLCRPHMRTRAFHVHIKYLQTRSFTITYTTFHPLTHALTESLIQLTHTRVINTHTHYAHIQVLLTYSLMHSFNAHTHSRRRAHTHIHTHTYTHSQMHAHTHSQLYTNSRRRAHTRTRTHTHTELHITCPQTNTPALAQPRCRASLPVHISC